MGRRFTCKGEINGHLVDVLWNTGAQLSIISNELLRRNFSGVVFKDISELLNTELNLTAANAVHRMGGAEGQIVVLRQ